MQKETEKTARLFLCGDVMTGRGIDQVLPYPSRPHIHEPYVRDAGGYVDLAERANGPIPRPVSFDYIWGDALDEMAQAAPDLRLINLETAVTTSENHWPKGINYRMHPANTPCLTAAKVDGCVLANNHVLDWGHAGLLETLGALQTAGIATVGAGRDRAEANTPLSFELPGRGRVRVFAFAHPSSGTPCDWSASHKRPGINFLEEFSDASIERVARQVAANKKPDDITILSIHWGGNWGYGVPAEQRRFAHRVIDEAGVDVVWGHSSHHPKGIEVYHDRAILYGCGDLLNDYEGIGGEEAYRGDLSLMYFLGIDLDSGRLQSLKLSPMQIHRFSLRRPNTNDIAWMRRTMTRECKVFGGRIEQGVEGRLSLHW